MTTFKALRLSTAVTFDGQQLIIGVSIVEPIENGTVAGPALNGTILPGIAIPTATKDETFQFPFVVVYGSSNDKSTNFVVQEIGVGPSGNQWTRIVCFASTALNETRRN